MSTKDLHLVVHIGLHKTASTYLQNVLSARRYDLIQHGVLFPSTGIWGASAARTRDGAQSGHAQFAARQRRPGLVAELLNEVPPTVTTVLLSSEDFTRPDMTPAHYAELLGQFASARVVLVLRRQDAWVESLYKQRVDQHLAYETRSFAQFLEQEATALLDFHARFSPWRELVGPESFHVLSYDDLADGAEIARRVLRVAGVGAADLGEFPGVEAPRYDSVRGIDTVGLRLLNSLRLSSRDLRDRLAREIYAGAPPGGLTLMTPQLRARIQERCAPINARIEAEWFSEPVPGLRFGKDVDAGPAKAPSRADLMGYLDHVLALCETGRAEEATALAAAEQAEVAVG